MKSIDCTISIEVSVSAQEAFTGINQVTAWWTENLEGNAQKLHDEFTVRFDEVHVSTQKIVESIPAKRITWLVTESKLNFVKDQSEWTNTKIVFDIFENDGKTHVTFTHIGLVPAVECYTACTNAWDIYIKGSLFNLLTKGKGNPEVKQKPVL